MNLEVGNYIQINLKPDIHSKAIIAKHPFFIYPADEKKIYKEHVILSDHKYGFDMDGEYSSTEVRENFTDPNGNFSYRLDNKKPANLKKLLPLKNTLLEVIIPKGYCIIDLTYQKKHDVDYFLLCNEENGGHLRYNFYSESSPKIEVSGIIRPDREDLHNQVLLTEMNENERKKLAANCLAEEKETKDTSDKKSALQKFHPIIREIEFIKSIQTGNQLEKAIRKYFDPKFKLDPGFKFHNNHSNPNILGISKQLERAVDYKISHSTIKKAYSTIKKNDAIVLANYGLKPYK